MEKRKRVLYVVTKSVWGGAQRYVYDLATNLPKDRFDVVVAAGPHTNSGVGAGGNGPLFEMLGRENVRTIQIPAFRRDINPLKEFAAFFQLLKVYIHERPDVIHLNSSKAGGLGALAAKVVKAILITRGLASLHEAKPRVIFTAHGWGFHEDRSWIAKKIILFISWFSSLFQDKIVLLNRADFAAAQKFIPARKLALIPNGIKEIAFLARPDARALLAQKIGRPIAQDTILIGAIAELTENKGLEYLIEAVSLIKKLQAASCKLQALIIGAGENEGALQKEINAQKLDDAVFLAGYIPHANQYLKAFDLFVLPSLKEGLPYAVMEAMAAGLPVIVTSVGGLPDLITDNEDGILMPPKDAKTLTEALQALAANPEKRAEIGARARETIRTKFGFHAMIDCTIKLYDTDAVE